MAFSKPTRLPPVQVRQISISINDTAAHTNSNSESIPASQSISYKVDLVDADGVRVQFAGDTGNLAPHLTAQQINQLQAFMASMRAKAEAEMLNGG